MRYQICFLKELPNILLSHNSIGFVGISTLHNEVLHDIQVAIVRGINKGCSSLFNKVNQFKQNNAEKGQLGLRSGKDWQNIDIYRRFIKKLVFFKTIGKPYL